MLGARIIAAICAVSGFAVAVAISKSGSDAIAGIVLIAGFWAAMVLEVLAQILQAVQALRPRDDASLGPQPSAAARRPASPPPDPEPLDPRMRRAKPLS